MKLVHPSGITETVPTGINGWAILFGCFTPLGRGDFKWFFISLAVCVIGSFFFLIPTIGMWIWLVVAYNDRYIKEQKLKGFVEQEGSLG